MTGPLSITNAGSGLYLTANPAATPIYGVRVDANQSSANAYYSTCGLYSDTDSEASSAYTYGTYSNAYGTYLTYGLYAYGRSREATAYGLYSSGYGDAGTTYGISTYASQSSGNNHNVYGTNSAAYAYGTGNLWGGRNYAYHYGTGGGDTYGLQATSYGSDTGTAYGVYATAADAANNYAGYFTTSTDTGMPVVGLQSSAYTLSDLEGYYQPGGFFGGRNGVIGFTEEDNGYGVYGKGTGSYTYGVYGYAAGDNVYGVYGYANASGTGEDSPRGVYGYAYGPWARGGFFVASGTYGWGLYASGTEYAAYLSGDVRVTGDLNVYGTKNFVAPHPNDSSQEIFYASLEGGESGVYVRGSAQLINGVVEIRLPEHFALVASEEGLSAHITPRDGRAKSYLYAEEVETDSIVVKEANNGTSNATFDYLVIGLRSGFEDFDVIREKTDMGSEPDASLEGQGEPMPPHDQQQ
jgi:hypothetical protein